MNKQETKELFRKLFNAMQDNPGLPVIPLVSGRIVQAEDGYWEGKFGEVAVEECYFAQNYRDEAVLLIRSEGAEIVYNALFDDDGVGGLIGEKSPEAKKIMQEKVDGLPWQKVIAVYIEQPE